MSVGISSGIRSDLWLFEDIADMSVSDQPQASTLEVLG